MSRFQPLVLIVLLVAGLIVAAAEEPNTDEPRARHLAKMRELAGSIRVLADPVRPNSAARLKEDPVLRYADNTRQTQESSLWIWSEGGRPAAILAIEYYPETPQGPRWLYELASLSRDKIAAELEGSFRWTADEPGLKLQALPDAPPPAAKEIQRLRQMKALRGRFTAYENATFSGRIELRPLATPLLRYSDAKEDVIDGAIFTLANGTNPEVLLVLEAQRTGDAARWRYALVQLTGEAVAVLLDGKQVWQQPGDAPPAVRASYINGWIAPKNEDD